MNRFLLLTLPLFIVGTVSAANSSNSIYTEIYGDRNTVIDSGWSVINGFDNQVLDGWGDPESRSSEVSNVTGSGNKIISGAYNSTFGNDNSLVGSVWHESSHLFGNGNSSNSGNANGFGNNNNITNGSDAVIGNNNTTSGDSVAIGNNNTVSGGSIAIGGGTASNGGIAIGSGSSASRNDEVNFGNNSITGIKAGTADADGVSLSQLNNKASETLNSANEYTDNTLNDAKNVANDYTDQKIFDFLNDSSIDFSKDNAYALARLGQLNNKLEKIQKQVNAGVASSIATSAVPHKLFKRFSYGMGVGSYKNEIGYSVGVKWGVSKNMALATAVSFNTQNDSSISLSLAYGF